MRVATRAFTLIELLVVVAMIAIFSGGTLAVITAPLMEERRATESLAQMSGRADLISSMTSDFHSAAVISFDDERKTLLTRFPDSSAGSLYFIDEHQCLRRATINSASQFPDESGVAEEVRRNSASLLGPVKEFTVSAPVDVDARLWTIDIVCNVESLGQALPSSVHLELAAGVSP